ncbi:MAG: hypothetical protein CMJ18_07340 [Phycisphaeraceae bacterium]|nr:hypothetical protein [Phycisphaeraceae bacterium]
MNACDLRHCIVGGPVRAVMLAALLLASHPCLGAATATDKKLICYGWGVPDTAALRRDIRDMEQYPFDGLGFRIKGRYADGETPIAYYAFRPDRIESAWLEADRENLRQVKFDRFTDNFLVINAAPGTVDWFDDEHWRTAMHNVSVQLEAALIVNVKGILFDPEIYSLRGSMAPLWRPKPLAEDPALFARYARAARQRGRQFTETIGRKLPDAVVLCLIQASYAVTKSGALDAADAMAALAKTNYALLPAFLDGMLDGIPPGMRIVDGNEAAYKYATAEQYDAARRLMKEQSLAVMAPENHGKYRKHVEAGQALYMDLVFAGRAPLPVEARHFEDRVYHAMRTADTYVWCYGESWLWWPPSKRRLPAGAIEAVLNARDRLAGADAAARRDLSRAVSPTDITLPKAVVPRVDANSAPPVIDGDLSDAAWRAALRIGPLMGRQQIKARAPTHVMVSYDDEHLYVAFDCREPHLGEIRIAGERRDGKIHDGDAVDLFVAPGPQPLPFFHFAVNPANTQWDALSNVDWRLLARDVANFDATWRSAVRKDDTGWTVEIAVAWQDMGVTAPEPDRTLRANVGRKRRARGWELQSWAPQMRGSGFDYGVEYHRFGTWSFGTAP